MNIRRFNPGKRRSVLYLRRRWNCADLYGWLLYQGFVVAVCVVTMRYHQNVAASARYG